MSTLSRTKTNTFTALAATLRAARTLRIPSPKQVAWGILNMLMEWQERHAERRALGRLDDRLLNDVGLSRADVDKEMSKPFWRP